MSMNMKLSAMILGLLASSILIGINSFSIPAWIEIGLFDAFEFLFDVAGDETIGVYLGIWLFVLSSIVALAGSIMTNSDPRTGGILLGAASVPNIIFTLTGFGTDVGPFLLLSALLLLVAMLLAFSASTQEESTSRQRTSVTTKVSPMILGILGSSIIFLIQSYGFFFIFELIIKDSPPIQEVVLVLFSLLWIPLFLLIVPLAGAIMTNSNPRIGAVLLSVGSVLIIIQNGYSLFWSYDHFHSFHFLAEDVFSWLFTGMGILLLLVATVRAFSASTQERSE